MAYTEFAQRLIQALKLRGHHSRRSPHGICIKTLASFADASEQICRRYLRGEALPCYEKVLSIAHALEISPAWLLFGETEPLKTQEDRENEILAYILIHSLNNLQSHGLSTKDYADFVLGLLKEIRDIDTSLENCFKIIDLAIGSARSFGRKQEVS